jgi:DNA-binding response OmpR family regulator
LGLFVCLLEISQSGLQTICRSLIPEVTPYEIGLVRFWINNHLIPGLPLVILSGSSNVADKVLLLEMGAYDYVTVPFSPRELVARLRALIRHASRVNPEGVYVFADVTVNVFKIEITRGGEKVMVTPKEFKTLEFLTKNAQRVISRDELLDKVWGYENYPCTRTVDNHMLRLRQKLESDPSHPSHFLTVHGLGYKFVP